MSTETSTRESAVTLTTGVAGEETALPAAPITSGPSDGALAPGLTSAQVSKSQRAGRIGAPQRAPLTTLRERRAAAEAVLFTDLPVPRMGSLTVRYRPVFSPEVNAITERITENDAIDKHRKPLVINAAILASACLGVFDVDDDGEPIGQPGSWPKFGPELREELGKTEAECKTAADVAEALYLTHGDLMAAAVELVQWSTQESKRRQQSERTPAGG